MMKRLMMCAVALLFAASIAFTGQKDAGKAGSWSGWITDNACGAKGANAEHAACADKCVKEHGGKYVLYTPADKKSYTLDPQDKAVGQAGHEVTVAGTLDGNTIHVTSITAAAAKSGQ
jgi:hypothetical protein